MSARLKFVKIKQVDAFTRIPFSGNAADVVTAASGLTVKQMKLIAREMNISETAFILPPKTPTADMRLRWFTAASEVNLCGHATIAAFHALAEEHKYGMNRAGLFKFNVKTRSGILPVDVLIEENEPSLIIFELPVPTFHLVEYERFDLATALSMHVKSIETAYPLSKNSSHLILSIKSREELFKIIQNQRPIAKICSDTQTHGLTVFTTDTVESKSAVHCRHFAPLVGVIEDPVTGSSLGSLDVYLIENDIIKPTKGVVRFVTEKGDCLDKPGRVGVEHVKKNGVFESVKILGNAITVLNGEIRLE